MYMWNTSAHTKCKHQVQQVVSVMRTHSVSTLKASSAVKLKSDWLSGCHSLFSSTAAEDLQSQNMLCPCNSAMLLLKDNVDCHHAAVFAASCLQSDSM